MPTALDATSHPVRVCQVCKSDALSSVIYLGLIPPVNTMVSLGSVPEEQLVYPLELLRCGACTLAQIGLEVDPAVLFPPDYPYRSASTKVLRENFADLYREASKLMSLQHEDLIVDIGSNDGTLLENFAKHGHQVLGIEPSHAADDAIARGVRSKMEFFSPTVAEDVVKEYGKARLVTATNVFAHMGEIGERVDAITGMLAPDGAFVSESHYLKGLIETLQYDTIYHEHLRYYSLGSLRRLLESRGLEVFHVKQIPTHGGSIRVYAGVPGAHPVQPSVDAVQTAEDLAGITDGSALEMFRARVVQSKLDFHALVAPLKRDGARIYGIGAPSRASTIVNYLGLDDGIIDCVLEISSSPKLNKYLPGTRIPVVDESRLFEDPPEYALLLSWHITDELVANLRRKGYRGRFITPLPTPAILE